MIWLKTTAAQCCILLSAALSFVQFKVDNLLPLVMVCVALVPLWWLRPAWRHWTVLIPCFLASALIVDAFFLHHRIAVEARTRSSFSIDRIEDIITSPSGRTTVYIVGLHWLDSDNYRVYLSTEGLFSRGAQIETDAIEPVYPRDITATWSGPLFTAGDNLASVAFTERDGKLYTFMDWLAGPVALTDPTKPRDAFARYIDTIH